MAVSAEDWALVAKYSQDARFGANIQRLMACKQLYPDNLACKHFSLVYFDSLGDAEKQALMAVVNSGIQNPDSGVGCYAMQPADYDRFKPFFSKVLADYHKVAEDAKHVNDWQLGGEPLDLTKLGLSDISMRVRVGRNLAEFPLPGAMSAAQRTEMEQKLSSLVFNKLIEKPEYGGKYYSLTPGHPNHITDEEYNKLVADHLMFKDMSDDLYLATAGIASNWPTGRGCYISADRSFIVWVGEEDHLRIMCMLKGTVLNTIFDRLKSGLDFINNLLSFVVSPDYGFVTSCPSNLGTGMRASVHVKCPKLTVGGSDAKCKAVCKPLGLSVRGTGGEHTAVGADGTVDISPSARFLIKEKEIISALYQGIEKLQIEESKA